MNIFTNILIKFIKGYKFLISPLLGQSCRYLPTCSEYSIEALKEFGLVQGGLMSYSYLVIAKSTMLNNEYKNIKETLFQDLEKIK